MTRQHMNRARELATAVQRTAIELSELMAEAEKSGGEHHTTLVSALADLHTAEHDVECVLDGAVLVGEPCPIADCTGVICPYCGNCTRWPGCACR